MSRKQNEITDLERQLEALDAELAAATAEASSLQAGRQMVLIKGSDDDLAKHDAAIVASQRKHERAAARIDDVSGRLAQARADKAKADHKAARKDAEAAAAAAAEAMSKGFAEIDKIIAALKVRVADATSKLNGVERVDGEDVILSVAARVFAGRFQQRQVLSEEIVERWVYETSGSILPDQTNVRTQGGDRGVFYSESVEGKTPHPVLLKKFRRREFLAERRYDAPRNAMEALDNIEGITALTFEDTRASEVEMIPVRDGAETAVA